MHELTICRYCGHARKAHDGDGIAGLTFCTQCEKNNSNADSDCLQFETTGGPPYNAIRRGKVTPYLVQDGVAYLED